MQLSILSSLSEVSADDWDSLFGDNPFTRHSYLWALEASGCVCVKTGWRPMHILLNDSGTLLAAMPLYLKYHSYGEYVFDWAWAEAYERNGVEYYPKLLNAVPFTPVSGYRIGLAQSLSPQARSEIMQAIGEQLDNILTEHQLSSWHSLFLPLAQQQQLTMNSRLKRLGVQYHWQNRDYSSFDDFLQTMTSRRRKSIRKERAPFKQNISFREIAGERINYLELADFLACYQTTYAKRSGHKGYLNFDFFKRVIRAQPEQVVLIRAEQLQEDGEVTLLASALFFKTATHLYGRYWGALQPLDGLHFELCYYRGIDYCIRYGLRTFDAGAQGEHKLLRGFEPVETFSSHQIAHRGFYEAIEDFTEREASDMQEYIAQAKQALPYKQSDD